MMLRNQRHENFARYIAEGLSNPDAHEKAGFKRNDQNAWRLRQRDDIKNRIDELFAKKEADQLKTLDRAIEKTGLTKAWILEETAALVKEARQAGAYGPAMRGMELLGREVYAFIERKEIGNPGDFDNMSEDELIRDIEDIARRLRAGEADGAGIGEAPDKKGMH